VYFLHKAVEVFVFLTNAFRMLQHRSIGGHTHILDAETIVIRFAEFQRAIMDGLLGAIKG
jgi:hypothetical protein